jgi:hypothetical protein
MRTLTRATLALLASPLVLVLSFTFVSDVQFMGWMLAALFLYVRGLRRGSDVLVFLGSIAAAAAGLAGMSLSLDPAARP